MSAGDRPARTLRRLLRPAVGLVLALIVVLGGYLTFVAVRRGQSVVLPPPTGQYAVGRATFDWTDASRTDPVAAAAGHPRELSVWLWYPANVPMGSAPAPYVPGAWKQLHLAGPAGLFEGSFTAVRDHAYATPLPAVGSFPIVVLEPGMGLAAPQYAVLAEDLASHGYLVAGVTPTYSANLTVLHDAPVFSTPAGNPPELGGHTGAAADTADRLVDVWAADAHFVASTVAGLDRAGPFAGRVARDQVAYVGHSFGGAAALQACSTDPHCAAAADLDGTQFGGVVRTGLRAPLMILGSQNSCVTGSCRAHNADDRADRDTAQTLLRASTGPTWCYSIDGTRHFNFTDDAVLYLAPPLRNLYALGSVFGARGLAIGNAHLEAFLDETLRHIPQPLLTERPNPYPEVRTLRTP